MSKSANTVNQSFLTRTIFSPTDGDLLVYFRIVFGVVSLYWAAKQFTSGSIEPFRIDPRFHFHYFGFGWVHSLGDTWTYIEFALLGVAAIMIVLGAFYRVASFVFALGFTHLFLVDKCLYLNHYYLICLIAWLMAVISPHREFSVDAWLFPQRRSKLVPAWSIWIIRFQIAMPYFFGGIAKLSPDWLSGVPIRTMLAQRAHYPVIGQYFTQEWCVYFFAYGGLLFDLLVIPALLTKRFRALACIAAVGFHITNAWLFTIGVFPWFMLLSLPIFFAPGYPRSWVQRSSDPKDAEALNPARPIAGRRLTALLLAVYIAWQLVFPLRHFAISGNPNWTEEGHCFAWHMLLRGKRCALRLVATDPASGMTGAIDLRPYVTGFQLSRLSRDPRLIHELVMYIAEDFRSRGLQDIQIRTFALVSMNGRKPQLLIDRNVDLTRQRVTWRKPDWIVPLNEPLRAKPWDLPISEWEAALRSTGN